MKGRAELPVLDEEKTIVAHVCNNIGAWGRGFTSSIDAIFPEVGVEFRRNGPRNLGSVNIVLIEEYELGYANMVAMSGVKTLSNPKPLQMDVLRTCLEKLRKWSVENGYSIQMPMIGAGLAGGNWEEISNLINEVFVDDLVTVVTL